MGDNNEKEKKFLNLATILEIMVGGLIVGLLGWLLYSVEANKRELSNMGESFSQIAERSRNASASFNELSIEIKNQLSEINRELETMNDGNDERISELISKVSRLEGQLDVLTGKKK